MMGALEVDRTDVTESRMATTAIVEAFDVEEDVGLGFFTRPVAAMMHPIRL